MLTWRRAMPMQRSTPASVSKRHADAARHASLCPPAPPAAGARRNVARPRWRMPDALAIMAT
jgi:hypothetical protein